MDASSCTCSIPLLESCEMTTWAERVLHAVACRFLEERSRKTKNSIGPNRVKLLHRFRSFGYVARAAGRGAFCAADTARCVKGR